MPAPRPGQASGLLFLSGAVLIALVLSSCAAGRSASEDRISRRWMAVQDQFDRLVAFELEFRVTAAAVAAKSEAEKLRFVRDALDRRAALQIRLKRELREFITVAASEPHAARVPYSRRVRIEMDKVTAAQADTVPSVKALALDQFEGELRAYQATLDTALREAR